MGFLKAVIVEARGQLRGVKEGGGRPVRVTPALSTPRGALLEDIE